MTPKPAFQPVSVLSKLMPLSPAVGVPRSVNHPGPPDAYGWNWPLAINGAAAMTFSM